MQFKNCVVVGVLITLCLSTDSLCHYIPEKKTSATVGKNSTSSSTERFQICGDALTTFILDVCNGSVNSPYEANSSKESVQSKITDDCCDQECPLEYFQSYCSGTPPFNFGRNLQGKSLNNLTRNRSSSFGAKDRPPYKGKNKGITEVRVREKKIGKRKWEKSKKRKRSFKLKCAYESFGHYLLKLERGDRVRDNMAKRQNTIKQTWPSIQIGTISPEMDKFGGQPIVVVKKKKLNTV